MISACLPLPLSPCFAWIVDFVTWVKGMGALGGILYAAAYIVGTALFFPGLPLTLGAGFVYGAVIGTLVVSPASVAGASVAFLIARYLRSRLGRPANEEVSASRRH